MESQNYLGIYIGKDTATVVCLGSQGKKVVDCFNVSVEGQEQADLPTLAQLITQGCADRRLGFSGVSVALDCAIFMQHNVHSEFSDPKQIAATVRFDTEDALATDITDVGLAFEIFSTGQNGSELNVFTAKRRILSEILFALQQHNFDPVTMEPDIICLSRFINRNSSAESRQSGVLFGLLSGRNGYLVVPPVSSGSDSRKASMLRTFMVGSAQDRGALLAREVLMTTALAGGSESISNLQIFDSAGTVDHQKLSQRLGIEAGGIDWLGATEQDPQISADCDNQVDFAIAYGAALANFEKTRHVNFRDDFSPFLGKKMKVQSALKFAATSVTILLIAIGLYFQVQVFKQSSARKKLYNKFAKDYSAVMLGKKPPASSDAVRKLGSELRRIRDARKGLSSIEGDISVSAKLTMVLTAFNKCIQQTDLNIKTVTITSKNITITGDTSGRQSTRRFFETIRNSGMDVLKPAFEQKGGRDGFNIIIAPK